MNVKQYFITRDQAHELFTAGSLNNWPARIAFFLPIILIGIGLIIISYTAIEITDNQILLCFGSLFFASIFLPDLVNLVRNKMVKA